MTTAIEPPLRPYFWLRRMIVGSVAVLVALLVARLIVGAIVERRWQARASQLRAAGMTLDIREWQRPPIADEENAAAYFLSAMAALDQKVDSPRSSNYSFSTNAGDEPPYGTIWQQLADASETANGPAFPLARKARPFTKVDWGVKFESPSVAIMLPHLNNARDLANKLADGAERSFRRGDSAEGVERIHDVFHLSTTLNDRPFFITGLVAIGIDRLAVSAIGPYVSQLKIGEAAREVRPQAIRALIARLTHADGTEPPLRDYVRGEALFGIDLGNGVLTSAWITRPAVIADMCRVGEAQAKLIQAAEAPTNVERAAILASTTVLRAFPGSLIAGITGGGLRGTATLPLSAARPISHASLTSSAARPFQMFAQGAAARDALAIALAVRLYEHNHQGDWPATLNDLVPAYLPAIPSNKVSDDDAPYGYRLIRRGLPDGRDRPLLDLIAPGEPPRVPVSPVLPGEPGGSVDLTNSTPPATQPTTGTAD